VNLLYPRIARAHAWVMLKFSCAGALVAAVYGVIHDEITFTIGPDYFTAMKFQQFAWADVGLPERWHVAEIGVLATWWVGFFGVWFMARIAVPTHPREEARRQVVRGVVFMLVCGMLGALAGYAWGLRPGDDLSGWVSLMMSDGMHAVQNPGGFVRAGLIHNGSYLGGLLGLIAALVRIRRRSRKRSVLTLIERERVGRIA
jgi:hypothetical protein